MTTGFSAGGYKYESPESRALGGFAADKFAYRDQGKNIIQLNNAVGYMSAMMRKMQKGIDQANQNFVQQIQGFITDFITMFAGGGDTGLDFGDLKYILQALGGLFGFADSQGNIKIPPDLFGMAWHFFGNFIGASGNFSDLINALIDNAIATVLDLFGEVPIVGQVLQQLAVIISDLRDLVEPIVQAVEAFFGAFQINLGNIASIGDFFGPFKPIADAIFGVLDNIELPDVSNTIGELLKLGAPLVQSLAEVITVVANIIKSLTGGNFNDFISGIFNLPQTLIQIISNLIFNGGLFNLNNLPFFPVSNLTNATPNLLIAPGFDKSTDVALGSQWTYDSATGRTTGGSLKLVQMGANPREFTSNNITVQPGDKINLGIWYKWLNALYGATPHITIGVVTFYATVELNRIDVTSQNLTATTQNTWQQITGTYTVPATGVDAIGFRVQVRPSVTGGTFWFDDGTVTKTMTTIPQSWVGGLLDSLGGFGALIGSIIDTFISVIRQIPFVGGTIGDLLASLIGWHSQIQSTSATAISATSTQSQQSIAKPNYLAMDATADAVFPIDSISGPTAQQITVGPNASVIGFIDTPDNGKKFSISWLGENTTGITHFYLNLWKLDVETNIATLLESSPDILGIVSNVSAWNYYNLFTPLDTTVGDVYAVEMVVTGTNAAYKMAGRAGDWKPPNVISAYPQQLSSVRITNLTNPPSSFSPGYSGAPVPWFALCSALFSGPSASQFLTPGTYTYTVPNWMKYGDCIDTVICPSGGQGSTGPAFLNGSGGGTGTWFGKTLIVGIDFPVGTTTLTLVVGAGGQGVTNSQVPGGNGGDCSVTGAGLTPITVTGGKGGGQTGAKTNGDLIPYYPGNFTFNNASYIGGSSGGASPGAGGNGGQPNSPGQNGGNGAIFMNAYQAGGA